MLRYTGDDHVTTKPTKIAIPIFFFLIWFFSLGGRSVSYSHYLHFLFFCFAFTHYPKWPHLIHCLNLVQELIKPAFFFSSVGTKFIQYLTVGRIVMSNNPSKSAQSNKRKREKKRKKKKRKQKFRGFLVAPADPLYDLFRLESQQNGSPHHICIPLCTASLLHTKQIGLDFQRYKVIWPRPHTDKKVRLSHRIRQHHSSIYL